MFRSDLQICLVNARLLERVESFKGQLWKTDPKDFGPTELAIANLKRSPWSSGERALLRFSFSLWNSSNACDVTTLFNLDNLVDVGSLLVAIASGADAVDEWLDQWADDPIPYEPTEKARAAVAAAAAAAGEVRDG